jgi:hypothetical protein
MGPVVGIAGALMADLSLSLLDDRPRHGQVWTLDGKTDRLRSVEVQRRADCSLCGDSPCIVSLDEARYIPGQADEAALVH